MRKWLFLAALTLLASTAHSQEADHDGYAAGLSVIPRLDVNPWFYNGAKNEYTWGNSSLYTLLEGDISESLSFSVCNHWLGEEPKHLYKSTLHSDDTNWLDWAYLTYSFGNFSVSAGKDVITTGGFEYDDYDYNVHPALASGIWNNLSPYQWGAKLAYGTADESQNFSFQMTASPYGEKPFSSGLYNYSVQWRGDFGALRTNWSYTALASGGGNYEHLAALGQQLDLGPLTLGVDYMNRVGNEENILVKGNTLMASLLYSPCDQLELTLKGGLENRKDEDNYWLGGLAANWYPTMTDGLLRLHLAGGYNSFYDGYSLTLGFMCYFNFHLFKK